MPKKMTEAEIKLVQRGIDAWSAQDGPLEWESVCAIVKQIVGRDYTRQGLHKIEAIRIAFKVRKDTLRQSGHARRVGSVELQRALERIEHLKAENARLEAQNRALLEQFTLWTYNASTRGLDEDFLNGPLPPIDRDATPGEPSASGRRPRAAVRGRAP